MRVACEGAAPLPAAPLYNSIEKRRKSLCNRRAGGENVRNEETSGSFQQARSMGAQTTGIQSLLTRQYRHP